MSRSNDAGHFFQTTASIEDATRKEAKKKNKLGSPTKLPSKLLAVLADLSGSGHVYVAESAGLVKRVNVDDATITDTYRIAQSPITCLAASPSHLYAGAWDKNIHGRVTQSSNAEKTVTFSGHTDFVKAILTFDVGGTSILVSASADASIIVWDAAAGSKLHQLKGHARGVQALAIESLTREYATIVSGDSSREIRRWYITPESSYEIPTASASLEQTAGPIDPLLAHNTSIYALTFDADGDMWTASADKTAKCLSRNNAFKADTTLQHPDFVRSIAIYQSGGLVVTACRDENVRIWEKGSGKLVHVYEGHFEEVTGIVVDEEKGRAVSVSIDGTVRSWGLRSEDIKRAKQEAERLAKGEEKEAEKKGSMLTAEEEAELAELMDSDDD